MIEFQLEKLPRQQFTTTQNGVLFDVRIFDACGVMFIDIKADQNPVILGVPLIPAVKLITNGSFELGNFAFSSYADEKADWQKFGISQSLIYFDPSELSND